MAIENSVSGAEASAIGLKFPSFSNAEWLKPFSEGPGKFYAAAWNEALGLTASHLQEQADYAKALSECTNPAEAFKYSTEFVQMSGNDPTAMDRNFSSPGAQIYRPRRTASNSRPWGVTIGLHFMTLTLPPTHSAIPVRCENCALLT